MCVCVLRIAYVVSHIDTKLIAAATENFPIPYELMYTTAKPYASNCSRNHQMQEINRKKKFRYMYRFDEPTAYIYTAIISTLIRSFDKFCTDVFGSGAHYIRIEIT